MKEVHNDHHAWYVVRTAREQEPSVAAALAVHEGVEIFLPRIRSRAAAGTLPAFRLEPVFPRHIFVRATVQVLLQRLESIPGAKEIAVFSGHVAEIPESEIVNFRAFFDAEQVINHPPHCNDPKAAFSLEEDPWLHLRAAIEFDFPAARRVRFLCRKLRILARDHQAPTVTNVRRRHSIAGTAPAVRHPNDRWHPTELPTSLDRMSRPAVDPVES